MTDRHSSPSELTRIRDENCTEDEARRLVAHFLQGCPECLENLMQLPPADPWAVTSPVARALRRIGSPKSWLELRSNHLELLLGATRRNESFATLIAEEGAIRIQEESGFDAIDGLVSFFGGLRYTLSPEALGVLFPFYSELITTYWGEQDIDPMLRLLEGLCGSRKRAAENGDAAQTLMVLAYFNERQAAMNKALAVLEQMLPRFGVLRRFEILKEIMMVRKLRPAEHSFGFGMLTSEGQELFAVLTELDTEDRITRLNGLVKIAGLAHKIAYESMMWNARPPDLSAVTSRVQASLGDVRAHGDERAQAWFHLALASCCTELSTEARARHFFAAFERWAKAGVASKFVLALGTAEGMPELGMTIRPQAMRLAAQHFSRYDQSRIVKTVERVAEIREETRRHSPKFRLEVAS